MRRRGRPPGPRRQRRYPIRSLLLRLRRQNKPCAELRADVKRGEAIDSIAKNAMDMARAIDDHPADNVRQRDRPTGGPLPVQFMLESSNDEVDGVVWSP